MTKKLSKIKAIKNFEVGISYSGRTYEEEKIKMIDGFKAILQFLNINFF